jgi:type IV pilus assembly protein PilQ
MNRASSHSFLIRGGYAALLLVALAGPAYAEPAATTHVRDVRVTALSPQGDSATDVMVVTDAQPKFSAHLADAGKRLLIDIAEADSAGAPAAIEDRTGLVGGVLTQGYRDASGARVRVSITMTQAASYRIRPEAAGLHVLLSPLDNAPAPAPIGQRPAISPPRSSVSPAKAELRDVRFDADASADRVVLELTATAPYVTRDVPGGAAVLEVSDIVVPNRLERTLDVAGSARYLRSISVRRKGDKLVLEAARGTVDIGGGHVEQRGSTLVWTFSRDSSEPPVPVAATGSTETGVAPDGGAARRTRTVAREAEISAIDLDLKDADIHNVLRLLADVGRVNVVTADNVTGNITIRMRNVPWDQALDVVLQAKGLGMIRQGNMIRVAPLADLEKERELAIARRKQELELAPVETRLIPVSYAQANDLQQRAREMLSPRGSIAVDERTNVLIARDVAGNLNQIEELVRSLDTQTPQVLVEARIVEATSRYLRDVGIQWGGDATFSQATGNPTGLAFPSTVGLVGGASDNTTPTGGLSAAQTVVPNPNFAVNLPATVGTGQGGALGITLGAINNSVNIGIRLSAAEASGMIRIISSPRVLTMDNREARISQGTLIPFAQVSAQGVQTTFQEANLQLLVRPHVTAEGSVAMHVKVNRDEPDFTQTSPRGDPTILKREAETDLLIMDGHTAVIGGIYTRNTGRNLDQVPFFGDIPLLGILFQRRRASDTRGELVIFLTPRIVNRAEALGR